MFRRGRAFTLAWFLAVAALLGAACSDDDDSGGAEGDEEEEAADTGGEGDGGGGLLAEVQDRGTLNCGVNNSVPGFGFETDAGFEGFDIDYCRGLAAAVLGDPEAVEYVALTPEQRFTALQAGEIDVLIRNTTWTSTRDGAEGAAFTTTTFYDGQAMMVPSDAGITSIDQLQDATICLTAGTTTEQNLADRMADIPHTPQTFEENAQVQDAFLAGQCDAWTSDASQLAGIRSNWPDAEGGPEALTILDEIFSKEPLGPAVPDGDSEWYDVVNWVVLATIEAEELGVSSENIDEMLQSEDQAVRRLLGQPAEGDEGTAVVDHGFGVDPDVTVDVIRAVGNYGEIYERNVGANTPLQLEREGTANALWTEGGLHYSPPFR
ncbi:MAG TPA: amino acid ABC transporter substrate-binding protein [Acidimicrobiales bacterium]|jgi:general L-amino acid transport system substrate-binding protein|nr:amino acid ABC transporter substrate-binding protein [Acidimicrobiales bacterium]